MDPHGFQHFGVVFMGIFLLQGAPALFLIGYSQTFTRYLLCVAGSWVIALCVAFLTHSYASLPILAAPLLLFPLLWKRRKADPKPDEDDDLLPR